MIIDYHSHIKYIQKENKYEVKELLQDMKENNITYRVVSALHGKNIREQNLFISKLVSEHKDKLIGSAVINPKEIDCLEEMDRICNDKNFKCIELDSLEHNYYPEDQKENIDEILLRAEKNNLIVNVFTGWGPRTMPAQWAFYAKRFPKVKFVLLHMGTTDFGYGCVDLVPRFDNLYVETSCMYEFPILRKAFSNINHDKFLFGTHFPDKLSVCSIGTFDLLNLDEEFRSKLFYKNAIELLRVEDNN